MALAQIVGRNDELLSLPGLAVLSHIMYLLISFRRSAPPQNRQLIVLVSNSKQYVDDFMGDDFMGELTFYNHFIDTFCKIDLLLV